MLTRRQASSRGEVPIAATGTKTVCCQSHWRVRYRLSMMGRVVSGIVLGTENSAAVWGYCGMNGCRRLPVGSEAARGGCYKKGILGS